MQKKRKSNGNLKSAMLVVLIILPVILGCSIFKNAFSRNNSAKYNPYTGSLSELLQPEIKGGIVTFKFQGSRDTLSIFPGAKEAKGFTYIQEGAGVQVPVDGAVVNYATPADAESALAKEAARYSATLTSRGKGKKFTAQNGSIVAWTNGTIICLVKSQFAKPAGNFEEAAPF